ncbi:putative presenilin associated, rhomboid-like protein [Melampsora larici-populina 98AG31]|uniref:Putative presenilin associated, rhomboid-like protein n=1 Tax=Melampsora larici-populina (strain 98AG31 / pathotype 3-4-7) TaxID=747676 RepID=F4R5J0_MELLP|nr:putative presenilin associated, rhomboid-like protein [Melampsora larici-populina 98AG31]EGG12058.1 putative presenilin associated, rhomboid-like protein [Melampsora larici-populina 98AG31]
MAFKATIESPVRLARRSIAFGLKPATTSSISIGIYARQSGWVQPIIQRLSSSSFIDHGKRSVPCSASNSRWFHTAPLRSQSLGKIELKRMPIVTHSRNSPSQSNVYNQTDNFDSSAIPSSRPTIWKPFMFCAGLTILGFGTAVYMTNKDTSSKIDYVFKNQTTFPMWFSKVFSTLPDSAEPSDMQLQQLRKLEKLNFIKSSGLNHIIPNHILTWYINLSEGKQICLVLALANLPIFLLWQLPRMTSYMTSNFTHNPLSGKSHTILTSVFSQASALHFGFNMMALYSIGSTAHDSLTHRFRASRDYDPVRIPESTPTYHFLAFYLFAGLFAGFASHAFSLVVRAPRLLRWRQGTSNTTVVPTPILPSLGASGAIYGCLTMTALAFPDAQVSLIFLPWIPINIGGAVTGAVLFDLMGVIRNWKFFDHAAHLGGAFAGVLWHLVIAKWFDVARLKFWSPEKNSHEKD